MKKPKSGGKTNPKTPKTPKNTSANNRTNPKANRSTSPDTSTPTSTPASPSTPASTIGDRDLGPASSKTLAIQPTLPARKAHPLAETVERLLNGEALLYDSPTNVLEVVGILQSYGVVLDAYSEALLYISDRVFLNLFPFFKYFRQGVSPGNLFRHLNHDRLNFEYAEYCMKAMFWHGGGKLDTYLDSPQFVKAARQAARAQFRKNSFVLLLDRLFPDFLIEQVRQMAYYSALGQFWRVMSDMFLSLSVRFDRGEIQTIPQVVDHIQRALVEAAAQPITYTVEIAGDRHDLIPASAGMQFLMETAVPYVEAVFFRGTPFPGTISYNAQAAQIPENQAEFAYGALYADPLPVGGAGIPPTLLMQDMRHFLPPYLHAFYEQTLRHEDDLLVKICATFQKSMFCVTTAALRGLAPRPIDSDLPDDREANRAFLTDWMDRFVTSRLTVMNEGSGG